MFFHIYVNNTDFHFFSYSVDLPGSFSNKRMMTFRIVIIVICHITDMYKPFNCIFKFYKMSEACYGSVNSSKFFSNILAFYHSTFHRLNMFELIDAQLNQDNVESET